MGSGRLTFIGSRVLDRPVRPVLLQEGLQVAHGLAQEAQSLAQYGSLQAAGNAVAPGSSALLAQTGLAPIPGQQLGQLVEPSERITHPSTAPARGRISPIAQSSLSPRSP